MSANILKSGRFFPLLATQFLGALNDNLFKNSLLTLVTIKMTAQSDILSNVIAGLFILPFFLFSATAGEVADKYARDKIARVLKLTELLLMLGVAVAYLLQSLPFLIVILALMGAQSAFFGPVKYSLLPQHLQTDELIAGNAYVESTTYAAILFGLVLGTLMPTAITIVLLIVLAVAGYIAASFIPSSPAPRPKSKIGKNIFLTIKRNIVFIHKYRLIATCIWGSTWFWVIGALVAVQIYPIAGKILNAGEGVISFFLILFSLGVAVGSYCCNKLLRGFIHATYVPLSAIGMGVSLYLLYVYTNNYPTPPEAVSFLGFFSLPHAFAIVLNLFLLAFWGGLYVIPLNAMMQNRAPKAYMATVIAGNNIINALGMVFIAIFAVVFLSLGFSIPQLFLLMAISSIIISVYICSLLPDALTRSLVQSLLRFLFNSRITGVTNFKRAGKKVLIVSNHISLLDGVLLAAFMPERITFAINTEWTQKWFIPIIRLLVDFYPIDTTNPLSLRALIEEVKKGRKVMMFPEGRVSVTGNVMKVYEGAGIIAAKSGAKILPVRISGAQYSKFSYVKDKFKTKMFPTITLDILEARKFEPAASNRHAVGKYLYDIMLEMVCETSQTFPSLLAAIKNAAKLHGKNKVAIRGFNVAPISYKELIKLVEKKATAKGCTAEIINFIAQKRTIEETASLISACDQMRAVFAFNNKDILLNPLEISSAGAMIYGVLLPLLAGVEVYLFHHGESFKFVPEVAYDSGATVLLGNEEVFAQAGVAAHQYDFFAIKYAISLQSKTLKEDVFNLWIKKFGIRVFEGYFSNEARALLSMNTPIYNKSSSLGTLLPAVIKKQVDAHISIQTPASTAAWHELPEEMFFDDEGFLQEVSG